MKSFLTSFFSALIFIALWVILSLQVERIRYTQYIEPYRVEISPKNTYAAISRSWSGKYLFFDVRSRKEYDELHASWAESVPIADLYDRWKTLPRWDDTPIYLICTSGRLAAVAYGYLQIHGFHNIRHIEGGISNWVSENQPVVVKKLF